MISAIWLAIIISNDKLLNVACESNFIRNY